MAERKKIAGGDWGGSVGDWGRGKGGALPPSLPHDPPPQSRPVHRGFIFLPLHYLGAWNSYLSCFFSFPFAHGHAVIKHDASMQLASENHS